MYPDIQRQVIANDVVKNLSVLSRFQLIEWKERNPFMKKLCVAFEGNKAGIRRTPTIATTSGRT